MSLSDLLEMDDDEVFDLVNEEYELLKKQAALYRIINDMMDQLERAQEHEQEIELELEQIKMENTSLRKQLKNMSK